MISFVGLKSQLLDWSEFLLSQFLDLGSVDDLWRLGTVDTRGFNRNDKVSSVFNEHVGVEAEDSSLIRLSNVSEDYIDHGHKHSVLLGVTSILNNWDHVGTLLGHVDKVSADSL